MITVTQEASAKISDLLMKEDDPTKALRMRVVGGGCAGLSYQMGFDHPKEKDRTVDTNGVQVIVDRKSAVYLTGVVIDYTDGLYGAGFKIQNPNAENTCGCGKSFS